MQLSQEIEFRTEIQCNFFDNIVGHFHDLVGRETSGKKVGLVNSESRTVSRSAAVCGKMCKGVPRLFFQSRPIDLKLCLDASADASHCISAAYLTVTSGRRLTVVSFSSDYLLS